MNNIDFIENLILVRNEPHIYAFSTNTIPNYLKVGDTFRPVDVRIEEWNKKISEALGADVEVKLTKEYAETAVIDDAYFRDYSVHDFLKSSLGKESIETTDPELVDKYSREFFKDVLVSDVESAIADIRSEYTNDNPNKKYTYYKLAEKKPADFHWNHDQNWELRPNQSKVVDNFVQKSDQKELLMYAVMRFGKSFTAMYCGLRSNARKILIVSAKADVATEWKATVEKPKCFENYRFLVDRDFVNDKKSIQKTLDDGKNIAVFLTLQNLSGKDKDNNNIKNKLTEVFATEYDLIIVDETHFGAWAKTYGSSLKSDDVEEDAQSAQDDQKLKREFEKQHSKLQSKTKLHLSGTPYNLLYDKTFNSDNMIAAVQFSDILSEKEKWDKQHFEDIENGNINPDTGRPYQEFDNPYFGFPKMLRFAFNPTAKSRERLSSLSKDGKWTLTEMFRAQNGEFAHADDVLQLMKIIDGSESDEGILSFLDIPKIKDHDVCKHMVFVLPFKSSCDAMAKLLEEHHDDFMHLSNYRVLNVAGHNSPIELSTVDKVKSIISTCETESRKTITLTVNKMLTGVTVKEWDTMIMLKNTHSAQEYDQAVFRIQNQYVKEYEATDGSIIKKDMKPQTILVDFDSMRIFEIQGTSSNIVSAVSGKDESFEESLKTELKYFPIITYNGKNLVKVEPNNIVEIITQYNSQKSILDEAGSITLDTDILSDEYISTFIKAQSKLGLTNALTADAHKGQESDIEEPEENIQNTSEEENDIGDTTPENVEQTSDVSDEDLSKQFRMCMANILFYVFLSNSKIERLDDILQTLEYGDEKERNIRIFNHLALDKNFIQKLCNQCSTQFSIDINNKIKNANLLSNDANLSLEKRATNALNRFNRISDTEVITPRWVCENMFDYIGMDNLIESVENGGKILDIAAKTGEFAYAIFYALKDRVDINKLKNCLYAIPTSGATYEFTRRMYEILGLNLENIANVDEIDAHSLYKKNDNGKIDYDRISNLLMQNKPFCNITINDEITEGDEIVNFDVVVGNPPYQEESKVKSNKNGQAPRTNVFHHFQIQAEKLSTKSTALIFPGIRWIHQSGKGVKQFGKDLINSPRLKNVIFYPKAKEVFDSADIQDGISIVVTESTRNDTKFTYEYRVSNEQQKVLLKHPGDDLIQLNPKDMQIADRLKTFVKKYDLAFLHDSVLSRSLFGIESDFAEKNQTAIRPFVEGETLASNEIKILTNDKAGSAGRSCWYVCDKEIIKSNQEFIKEWQVVVSSAHPGGQDGRDNQIAVIDNQSAFGRARVALKSFKTQKEAENFYKYANCCLIKYAFLLSDEALSSLARFVPDLISYVDNNTLGIDFSQSIETINEQLCQLCELTEEEKDYIKSIINPME